MNGQIILNKEFYENVRKDCEQYSNSYHNISERSKLLEKLELQRTIRAEESYEILEKFGAIS